MGDWERRLHLDEARGILASRQKIFLLYEGRVTPHRSCGIAMAETFGLATAPYQALRKGGLTGCGVCGVVMGARLVLGEVLGDPDPTGSVTPHLHAAMTEFEARWPKRTDRGQAEGIVCNVLTAQFDDFRGAERAGFCTRLATEVGTLLAEVLVRNGHALAPTPIDGVPGDVFDPGRPADPLP